MANHRALEKKHGVDRGRWFGPGTVLGVQTVRANGENPQPARKVWVVMGARLRRCAPEQLRAASPREEEIFTEENGTPWTFVEALNHLNKGEVISVDKEDVPMYEETYVPEATARAPCDSDLKDYWTEEEFEGRKTYVRVHLRHRTTLFAPEGYKASIEGTTMERVTVAKFEDGSMETVRDDNWKAHRQTQRSLKGRWTGKTYFFPRPEGTSDGKDDPATAEGETTPDSSTSSAGATGSGAMPLNRPMSSGPVHEGDTTEAVRVAVEDRDDPDLMVDTEIEPTLITNNEKLINMNRQAESGKRKKKADLTCSKRQKDVYA